MARRALPLSTAVTTIRLGRPVNPHPVPGAAVAAPEAEIALAVGLTRPDDTAYRWSKRPTEAVLA
jgi:hypothetical protein